jgi:uncharacterized C2H2 Zn-finger protein
MSSLKRKQFKPKRIENVNEIDDSEPLDLSIKSKKMDMNRDENIINKPLDLRIRLKNAHSNEKSNAQLKLKKLVRGQEDWLNRSNENFISKILKCIECSLSFETLEELSNHMAKTNHFLRFRQQTSVLKRDTTFNNSTNSNGSLICLICRQRFPNELTLAAHLQNKHTITQICTQCGAYFETISSYREHLLKEDYHQNQNQQKQQQQQQQQQKQTTKRQSFFHKDSFLASIAKLNNCKNNTVKFNVNQNENAINLKRKLNNSDNANSIKNPLVALELFVSKEISHINSKKQCKNVENPLQMLQKMKLNIIN